MYELVRSELPQLGYPMYEISNYAPPGHEARHNLSYWKAESYLGLGAGAHSFALICADSEVSLGNGPGVAGSRDHAEAVAAERLKKTNRRGGRRWWNERLPLRYIARASAGTGAEAGSELLNAEVAAGEYVFLNLRLREGFDLAEFERRFGESFYSHFGRQAARLFEGGLLIQERGRVFLSDRGIEIADSVFAEFV